MEPDARHAVGSGVTDACTRTNQDKPRTGEAICEEESVPVSVVSRSLKKQLLEVRNEEEASLPTDCAWNQTPASLWEYLDLNPGS